MRRASPAPPVLLRLHPHTSLPTPKRGEVYYPPETPTSPAPCSPQLDQPQNVDTCFCARHETDTRPQGGKSSLPRCCCRARNPERPHGRTPRASAMLCQVSHLGVCRPRSVDHTGPPKLRKPKAHPHQSAPAARAFPPRKAWGGGGRYPASQS